MRYFFYNHASLFVTSFIIASAGLFAKKVFKTSEEKGKSNPIYTFSGVRITFDFFFRRIN